MTRPFTPARACRALARIVVRWERNEIDATEAIERARAALARLDAEYYGPKWQTAEGIRILKGGDK